jgi:hypothetical protein
MSVGKGLRWKVLQRDNFTCQYCGRKAPNVVLHVDHRKPTSEGGKSNIENLVTSCESCNTGKCAQLLETLASGVSLGTREAAAVCFGYFIALDLHGDDYVNMGPIRDVARNAIHIILHNRPVDGRDHGEVRNLADCYLAIWNDERIGGNHRLLSPWSMIQDEQQEFLRG